jgi:Uma2 family endonuclease
MTATLIQSPDRVILKHISWQTYQSLILDFKREPAMRLTYNLGTLEIRMPLAPHETCKKILGRLIETATEELNLEIRSLGSLTCSREDLAKGLEPDQCYYIQNEAMVRGIAQVDLAKLPPPDLAVEIDITISSLDRFAIYADLQVPEIWRYDGQLLAIYGLVGNEYIMLDRSVALPLLKTEDNLRFLSLSASIGENNLVKQFRQWLRTFE